MSAGLKKARALAVEYHNKTTKTFAQLEDVSRSNIEVHKKLALLKLLEQQIEKYGALTWFWFELSEQLKGKHG